MISIAHCRDHGHHKQEKGYGQGQLPSITLNRGTKPAGHRAQRLAPARRPAILYDVGYTGGIAPDNIGRALEFVQTRIPADRDCWLDLEGGARDEQGRFDLDRVETLCKTVAMSVAEHFHKKEI